MSEEKDKEIEKLKQLNSELSKQALSLVEESLVIGFGRVHAQVLKDKIEKPLLEKINFLENEIKKLRGS